MRIFATMVRSRILGYVAFTFIAYFTIGLALAILPVFIDQDLGYGTMVAGLVISTQYVTTFLFRGYAGSIVDKRGPKPAVVLGMTGFIVSGALLFIASLFRHHPALSLVALVFTRLATGFGEGLVGVSPINWAILSVGEEETARAISFNGIASYGALAVGAPCGVILQRHFGLGVIGLLIVAVSLAGLFYARKRTGLKAKTARERQPFLTVLKQVTPYGIALAMGSLGFGAISTFITLYYRYLHWDGAVLGLSLFSILFIIGRLIFGASINRRGGLRTAIICLAVETAGLFVLWQAGNPWMAFAGAGLTGLGFSLVFPALGVEAVRPVPASNKGAALSGYGLFIDVSLGITGPFFGFVASSFGMRYIYAFAMIMVMGGLGVAVGLSRRGRVRLSV
jgi:MFS family permease